MKTQRFLLLASFGAIAHASPARRDCGETKTFSAVDLCGSTFGGSWIECASGMTATPTFSMPACSISTSAMPIITVAPSMASNGTTTACIPQTLCMDAIKKCGEGDKWYGTCYDLCTPEAGIVTAPTCEIELPSSTVLIATDRVEATSTADAPPREMNPACVEKPFLCAPPGW
ncbi:hypothetical protein ACEQ8H_000261 [Pleosporales sp. CAS-2024a]